MYLSRTAFRAAILHLSVNPIVVRASLPSTFSLSVAPPQTPSSRLYTVLFPQCAPVFKTEQTRLSHTMSSQTPESKPQDSNEPESQPQSTQETLYLPSSEQSEDQPKRLDLSAEGGSTVTLDHLGPMVVNVDGTLARISNWQEMAEIERKNTLRVLGKRNKQRLEALKAREAEQK